MLKTHPPVLVWDIIIACGLLTALVLLIILICRKPHSTTATTTTPPAHPGCTLDPSFLQHLRLATLPVLLRSRYDGWLNRLETCASRIQTELTLAGQRLASGGPDADDLKRLFSITLPDGRVMDYKKAIMLLNNASADATLKAALVTQLTALRDGLIAVLSSTDPSIPGVACFDATSITQKITQALNDVNTVETEFMANPDLPQEIKADLSSLVEQIRNVSTGDVDRLKELHDSYKSVVEAAINILNATDGIPAPTPPTP